MIDRYNSENQHTFARKPETQSGFINQTRIKVGLISVLDRLSLLCVTLGNGRKLTCW
jgi:hypothetical protein